MVQIHAAATAEPKPRRIGCSLVSKKLPAKKSRSVELHSSTTPITGVIMPRIDADTNPVAQKRTGNRIHASNANSRPKASARRMRGYAEPFATRNGVAIVISDFLTAGDVRRAFNLVHSSGLEIWAVQVLGPSELDPELAGDLRLIDCETLGNLDISSAGDLLALYHEYRTAHEAQLTALCQQRSGRFLSLSAGEPLDRVVFDVMRRKGWII